MYTIVFHLKNKIPVDVYIVVFVLYVYTMTLGQPNITYVVLFIDILMVIWKIL